MRRNLLYALFQPDCIIRGIMKIIGAIAVLLLAAQARCGEIAITFDDIPTGDSVLMSGVERTNKIAKALKDTAVPDALFFVKTDGITPKNKGRLQMYISYGYHIANHSHSHLSASKIPVHDYLQDVYLAHLKLKSFDNFLPFHRFPYLHYGKDTASIEAIQQSLSELNYQNGYVTVDNFDWYMNALLVKAKEEGKTIDYARFGEVYVSVIWQAIEFYDNIAKSSLGSSPKHVLLLHENDAAAMYLPKLIQHIRDNGWAIISPQEAYQDPIANTFPSGTFHKQGRVAALAHNQGQEVEKLRHPAENQAYLDALFVREKVFH